MIDLPVSHRPRVTMPQVAQYSEKAMRVQISQSRGETPDNGDFRNIIRSSNGDSRKIRRFNNGDSHKINRSNVGDSRKDNRSNTGDSRKIDQSNQGGSSEVFLKRLWRSPAPD